MNLADGRKALVTGGASGFGREIASRLTAAGARVAVLDLDEHRVGETAAELGDGATGVVADVRSRTDMDGAVARCAEAFGGLDTVVLSAGVFDMRPLAQVTEADWDLVLAAWSRSARMPAGAGSRSCWPTPRRSSAWSA